VKAAFYKGTRQVCRASTAALSAGLIATRLAANFSTFPHAGKVIACEQSLKEQLEAATAPEEVQSVTW